jgi:Domain of unknown function (DUF4384)
MKAKAIWCAIAMALATVWAGQSFSRAQDPNQDDVRGAFLTTRPQTADKPAKSTTSRPSRRRPKTTTNNSNSSTTSNNGTSTTSNNASTSRVAAKQRIGLGLTMFMRDSSGLAVRVDPAREFHQGERVRILLETNVDGYLYVFDTTDGSAPLMIYPSPQLDDAGNFIKSHIPFEIPSSLATEDRLRWFRFDEHAGLERLYFVFTREPLAGVPIEDELIKACGSKDDCSWSPSADLWASLQKEAAAPMQQTKTEKNGVAQTRTEHDAATRGIGLAKDDPEPSLVMMTASASPTMLVTALELVHK